MGSESLKTKLNKTKQNKNKTKETNKRFQE